MLHQVLIIEGKSFVEEVGVSVHNERQAVGRAIYGGDGNQHQPRLPLLIKTQHRLYPQDAHPCKLRNKIDRAE